MLSAALLLGGCGSTAASGGNSGNNSAGADVTKDKTKDAADKTKKAPEIEGLTYESTMDLTYATEFDVYYYKDGYKLIDVHEDKQYLIVPKGKEEPEDLADDIVVIQQPIENIYTTPFVLFFNFLLFCGYYFFNFFCNILFIFNILFDKFCDIF